MKKVYRKGLEVGWKMAALRRVPSNSLICPVCGKSFQRRGKRKVTFHKVCCSKECRAKGLRGIPGKRKKTGPIIQCKVCGKQRQRPPSQTGKYCSRACHKKDPDSHKSITGANHYNWKGGISPKNQVQRKSKESREWTRSVFKRDSFRCKVCTTGPKNLQAHHNFPWAEFPNLRFALTNGITLCVNCHKLIHWCGRYFTKKINKHSQTMIENGHWYSATGEPKHFVAKKDGSGMRPTTLADARKNGWLPSVTQVLRVLDKPALREWLIKQAVMAVVTAPDVTGESLDDKITRILETERQQDQESQIARDRGTEMHAALELLFQGRGAEVSAEILPWVSPAFTEIANRAHSSLSSETHDTVFPPRIETVVVGDGYAGKVDLMQTENDGCLWIWDWKTTKKLPKCAYPEARLQCSGYAMAVYGDSDHISDNIRTGNVYISTVDQGKFVICEHEPWLETWERGFKPLLTLWQFLNQYTPQVCEAK